MHRFYMVQSFTRFHRNVSTMLLVCFTTCFHFALVDTPLPPAPLVSQVISPAALFLAAKVEEQPRKLEHVIKVAHACLNPQEPSPDVRSDVSVSSSKVSLLGGPAHSFYPNGHSRVFRSASNQPAQRFAVAFGYLVPKVARAVGHPAF